MKNIKINKGLRSKCPKLRLGCLSFSVQYVSESEALQQQIETISAEIATVLQTDEISQLPNLQAARQSYRALGKAPSRYRLSAEALLRRVVQGKGMYQINPIVDALNLVSIQTAFSIGGYDLNKIQGDIYLDIGKEDTPYNAIGKGEYNIANLPVLNDEKGAFGTPTSDSVRTSVTPSVENFLMVFFDFDGAANLSATMEQTATLYQQFMTIKNIETSIV